MIQSSGWNAKNVVNKNHKKPSVWPYLYTMWHTSSCTITTWTRRTVSPCPDCGSLLNTHWRKSEHFCQGQETFVSPRWYFLMCVLMNRACQFPYSNYHPLEPWKGLLALIPTHNITQCYTVRCSICLLWPVSWTNLFRVSPAVQLCFS